MHFLIIILPQIDVNEQTNVIKGLKMVEERFMLLWNGKLKATESSNGELGLPRVIRLSRKLQLNDKETRVLAYIMLAQVRMYWTVRINIFFRNFPLCLLLVVFIFLMLFQLRVLEVVVSQEQVTYIRGNVTLVDVDISSICRICDMKLREIVNFLGQDRIHMQQGLFPEVQQSNLLNSSVSFSEIAARALVGVNPVPEEFLKLEQTCLADVIVEEPGNEHLRIEDIPVVVGGSQQPSGSPTLKPGDVKVLYYVPFSCTFFNCYHKFCSQ